MRASGHLLALLLVASAACGGNKDGSSRGGAGGGGAPADPFEWAAAPGPGTVEVSAGGDGIRGVVRYQGEPPADQVQRNAAGCGGATRDPIVRVVDGALQGAVVYLVGATGEVAPRTVRMTQKACLYEPPVVVATVGSRLVIGNDDPLLHNLHGYQDGDGLFNKPSSAGADVASTLDEPGIVLMKCDVHPWMLAHIAVFDHPYHALVDDAGRFALPAPPPGDYELVVWHAKLGAKRTPLTVSAGAGAEVTATYP